MMTLEKAQEQVRLLTGSLEQAHSYEAVLKLKNDIAQLITGFNNLDKSKTFASPVELSALRTGIASLRSAYQASIRSFPKLALQQSLKANTIRAVEAETLGESKVSYEKTQTSNLLKEGLTLLSYNIDTNILRTEEGYARDAFPEWRANERASSIREAMGKIIHSYRPTIIQIQEGRKFTTKFGDEVDSVTPLVNYLKEAGYNVLVQPYNGGGGEKAFKFITAYDPRALTLLENGTYIRYLTQTPEQPTPRPSIEGKSKEEVEKNISSIKSHNFGVEWERGVFIVGLQEPSTGQKIYSLNAHFDIVLEARKNSSRLLVEFVKEIIVKEPDAKILISGDFNTFADWGGPEQMAIINSAVLNGKPLLEEPTRNLRLPDGSEANFSFIAFPYDFAANEKRLNMTSSLVAMSPKSRRKTVVDVYEKECQALGSVLDHVFSRGFEPTYSTLVPATTTEAAPTSYSEDAVRTFVVGFTREQGKPAFASDHQPIVTNFKFRS
ncbi:MAG TPA: hypothetical protein PLV31_06880 [Gammaproteobacteria bacterium]|nr:hypothetical protein [Gammaproteobacteria bacterium]